MVGTGTVIFIDSFLFSDSQQALIELLKVVRCISQEDAVYDHEGFGVTS
jgi:hypothetical protein